MKELLEGNEIPKPFDYYVQILRCAFEFIKKNPVELDVLNNEYITFQQHLLKYMKEQDEFEDFDTNMFESQVLDQQDKIEYKLEKKRDPKTESIKPQIVQNK